jgi:hypothetical protein
MPPLGDSTAAPIRLRHCSGPREAERFAAASTWLWSSLGPAKWIFVLQHGGVADTSNGCRPAIRASAIRNDNEGSVRS